MTEPLRPTAAASNKADTDSHESLPTHARAETPAVEPSFAAPEHAGEVGTFGRYRVLKKLGQGGMGAVYLGFDSSLDRKIALKVMLPQLAGDSRERFLREARAAAKIHSDHVVTIHDVGEERGVPFIAMEYLLGAPLDQFLKVRGELPLPQAVRVVRETALGLSAAHELGLVHRDIKPGNVWLEAPKGRVKILDFGLVRAEGDAQITSSGAVVGTPAYMSPEQARGQKVDHRSDLFSLGAMLYRLCTGKQPFTGDGVLAVLTALAVDTPVPPRQHNPEIPEALEAVINKLLSKNPDERYRTAQEVVDALAGIEQPRSGNGHLPVVAVPVAPLVVGAQTQNVWEGIEDSGSVAVPLESGAETGAAPAAITRLARKNPERGALKLPLVLAGAGLLVVCAILAAVVIWSGKKEPVAQQQTEENRPTPAARPAAAPDPDRRAAEWVLAVGGTVHVNGEEKVIEAVGELPKDRFTLTTARLDNNPRVTAAGLANFKGCTGLTRLEIVASPIPDAGLVHFKDCKNLTSLTLPQTLVGDIGLPHFKDCRNLEGLNLSATKVTNAGLVNFKDCKQLVSLYLDDTQVGDAGLIHFKGHRNLKGLLLARTQVTDAGLAYFKDCQQLTSLHLDGSPGVTDTGLSNFKGCRTLRSLSLGPRVTDAGVENFKDCTELSYLLLLSTKVTDAGLAHFKNCKNLTSLNCQGTPVGDAGLAHFKDFKNLTSLDLIGTQVTDAGLAHFKDRKILTHLNVEKTKVTWQGVVEFAKANPRCEIFHDDGTVKPTAVLDPNRAAAKCVFDAGGFVRINGEAREIRGPGELPKGPFALTAIDLTNSRQVTDAGLAVFKGCESLVFVRLGRTPVTDAGMVHFKDNKNLTHLYLNNTQVTDAGLAHFKGCAQLTNLNLSFTRTTDVGLANFKDSKTMMFLHLSETQVSDTGLVHFKDCKNLKTLSVQKTRATAALVEEFRKAGCLVHAGDLIEPEK